MPIGNIRAHLGEVLQWSPARRSGGGDALVAALALVAVCNRLLPSPGSARAR